MKVKINKGYQVSFSIKTCLIFLRQALSMNLELLFYIISQENNKVQGSFCLCPPTSWVKGMHGDTGLLYKKKDLNSGFEACIENILNH